MKSLGEARDSILSLEANVNALNDFNHPERRKEARSQINHYRINCRDPEADPRKIIRTQPSIERDPIN